MKKTMFAKTLSFIACIVLIAAMALVTTGCKDDKKDSADTQDTSSAEVVSQAEEKPDEKADVTVLGEGQTTFSFKVVDKEGTETAFEIHTDQKTVGAALLELNVIAGEDSQYGLYVKTVNGVTLDYNTDGMYWAFYINGEYAMTGVDSTDVAEGAEYTFKAEK